jgi:hypothetical protein
MSRTARIVVPSRPHHAGEMGPSLKNRRSALSFSESFGRPPIRPKVENPEFVRVPRASILPGFDSDTLTTRRFELPSDGCRGDERVLHADTGSSRSARGFDWHCRGWQSLPECSKLAAWTTTSPRCENSSAQGPCWHGGPALRAYVL